jgi:DNA-nicking Smr family endonuclease
MWPFYKKKRSSNRPDPLPGNDEIGHLNDGEPFVVTDTLDLHGFFPQQVPKMVAEFVDNALRLGLRRLRIVHGKGRSRLKWEVHQVLKAHPAVGRFSDAPPEAGGWGATIVLLKKPRPPLGEKPS